MKSLEIRKAVREDIPLILQLIQEIASYERLLHEVTATEEVLVRNLFDQKSAEVIIGELDGIPVGYALFFHNFSTFLGRKGLYLEDLFVRPDYRGQGFGKKLLLHLVRLAKDRDCGRMEWSVLNWNTSAIEFYKSLGAIPMEGWTGYRLDQNAIDKLTTSF